MEAHNFHKAAAYGLNGDGTTVHIVDTGFNPNHSQLSQSDYQKDPINGFSNATSERDHGHQVMATIGANKGDGLTVGVAPKTKFKLTSFGKLNNSVMDSLTAATKWAKGSVAQNNSWGCDYYSFGNLQQDKAKFSSQSYESILDAQMYNYCRSQGAYASGDSPAKIKNFVNALDDFQKTGVVVWANPNSLEGNLSIAGPGVFEAFLKFS